MRVDQNRHFGLTQHVDEAGRNYVALRVNDSLGRHVPENTYLRDSAVNDADVAGVPRRARAVDNVAVANDQIKRLRRMQRGYQYCKG